MFQLVEHWAVKHGGLRTGIHNCLFLIILTSSQVVSYLIALQITAPSANDPGWLTGERLGNPVSKKH